MRGADKKPPEESIASLGDPELRLEISRAALSWSQSEVRPYRAGVLESSRVSKDKKERERRQRSNARHLSEHFRLRVLLLAELFLDPFVVAANLMRKLPDHLHDRRECAVKFLGDGLRSFL